MKSTNEMVYSSGTPKPPVDEIELATVSGYAVLIVAAVLVAGGATLIAVNRGPSTAIGAVLLFFAVLGLVGLTTISPGQVRVVQVFGHYKGTVRKNGLRWVNPFSQRRPVSVRIRNQESATVKVNDADGNPIEMAAVVVWQVQDSARAIYAVDDFVAFVTTQSETAIRHVANTNPYDNGGSDALSLRDHTDEIATQLARGNCGPGGTGGRPRGGGEDHPVVLRSRNRASHAPAPTSGGGRGGPVAHCRGRRRHGADGAGSSRRGGYRRAR